jgi:uncharacterized delta-60 repeat protein
MTNRLRATFLCISLSLSLALIGASASWASAGFDANGRVLTAFPNGKNADAAAITHDSQGRLIVVGCSCARRASNPAPKGDIAVARYLPDGRLDASFGNGGLVITDLGGQDTATDVAVDSLGRIVVAVLSCFPSTLNRDVPVIRYLPDGSLDQGFGEGGLAHAGSSTTCSTTRLAVDSSDRILVGGSMFANDTFWGVARLTPEGALDTSFGNTDRFPTPGYAAEYREVEDIAIDSAGRIFLALAKNAEHFEGFPEPMVLLALTPSGDPDPSFGHNGLTSTIFGKKGNRDSEAYAHAVAIDGHGRIVLVGQGTPVGHIVRILPSGDLDRSFSSDGKAMFFGEGPSEVAIASQDGIFASGSTDFFTPQFALGRFDLKGRPNRRLGPNGIAVTRFGRQKGKTLYSSANSLTIVGKTVYVAGTAWPRNRKTDSRPDRFALFRYSR